MMSQAAVDALIEKFGRGYLDVELQEKARAMNPNLAANNFRFLADVGVQASFARPSLHMRPHYRIYRINAIFPLLLLMHDCLKPLHLTGRSPGHTHWIAGS